MTRIVRRMTTCAICAQENETDILYSIHSNGAPDLDFRPSGPARHAHFYKLQNCIMCNYANSDLSKKLKNCDEVMASDEFQKLTSLLSDVPEFANFQRGVLFAEKAGDRGFAADLALASAWIADDLQAPKHARAARKKAIELYSMLSSDPKDDDEFIYTCLLVIDLHRRISDWNGMLHWSYELSGKFMEPSASNLFKFQLDLFNSKDCEVHTIDEATGEYHH